MFSSGPSYNKLKTNLRLCINRLKLLEKKKTELALKSRKEIADYISAGKVERAKIRVEHIIREDYLVEAMEVLEMYCDLLLARFGLIQQMKTLDDGLAEAISSIIWVTPRLQSDVQELKIVSDQLAAKYGKPYALACRENGVGTVSEKLIHKLNVQAPPKITVEKYLIEIAKYYNVDYEPDPQILTQDEQYAAEALIDLAPAVPNKHDLGGPDGPTGGGAGGGYAAPPAGAAPFAYPQPPMYQQQPPQPFQYPQPGANAYPGGAPGGASAVGAYSAPAGYPQGPTGYPQGPTGYPQGPSGYNPAASFNPDQEKMSFDEGPPPYFPPDVKSTINPNEASTASANSAAAAPETKEEKKPEEKMPEENIPDLPAPGSLDLPELPGVPADTPVHGNTPDGKDDDDDIDFDDLTRRFEALKKKK